MPEAPKIENNIHDEINHANVYIIRRLGVKSNPTTSN